MFTTIEILKHENEEHKNCMRKAVNDHCESFPSMGDAINRFGKSIA
jgi:hypothetical protein